jgi:UrcA family protein
LVPENEAALSLATGSGELTLDRRGGTAVKSKIGTLQFGLTALGFLLVGATSVAQPMSQVIVEVPRVEKSTHTGAPGQRRETLSIVYKVDYSDLNLATHSGAVELQNRIKDSAKQACQQLATLFPDTTEGDTPCVQGAVKGAMVQANKFIAAAEAAKT